MFRTFKVLLLLFCLCTLQAILGVRVDAESQLPAPESHALAEAQSQAIKLIEVSGGRDQIQAMIPKLVQQGQGKVRSDCPRCDQAFITEWGKRMTARLTIDDFVKVAATPYVKHYSGDELKELTVYISAIKTGAPATLSPTLHQKFMALKPTINGESRVGGRELGEKTGREVTAEMLREHPEYFPAENTAKSHP